MEPSPRLLGRGGETLFVHLNDNDHWNIPAELAAISPYLKMATIAAEDQRFYAHPGVDPLAVLRAAWEGLRAGGIRSGASTLPMQLIKRDGVPTSTLRGKARQALLALKLDAALSKDVLLTAYLNSMPYGRNLLGCEAASRRFFGKAARELTLSEAALLAGLPKAPATFDPLRHPEAAKQRRAYVLKRMEAEGFISSSERLAASAAPLGAQWTEMPRLAPHLAAAAEASGVQHSTIVGASQRMVEEAVQRAVQRHRPGIANAAAVVLDAATGELHAYAGSADFYDAAIDGQVDVCLARRSPGSALKPFIYGAAMESQQLYPHETMLDAPWRGALYDPGNFEPGFSGLVSASGALRTSLNIPALTVLNRIGIDAGLSVLRQAGLTTLERSAREYGLGLTLGTCEVRLLELTRLYAALARLEVHDAEGKALLSPAVCMALYEMLEQPLPQDAALATGVRIAPQRRCAWKTGTSPGQRDAWAFVFNRWYAVGVWMGNNDGTPDGHLTGAHAALPLAGEIFRALPEKDQPEWPSLRGAFRMVECCALSGLPIGPHCPAAKRISLPRRQYLHRTCALHRAPRASETVRLAWPSGPRDWDLSVASGTGPPAAASSRALAVEMPGPGASYVMSNAAQGDRITLAANVQTSSEIHWYLNGRFLGTEAPGQPIEIRLEPGSHRVVCMLPDGRRASAAFEVVTPAMLAEDTRTFEPE